LEYGSTTRLHPVGIKGVRYNLFAPCLDYESTISLSPDWNSAVQPAFFLSVILEYSLSVLCLDYESTISLSLAWNTAVQAAFFVSGILEYNLSVPWLSYESKISLPTAWKTAVQKPAFFQTGYYLSGIRAV
jgi:hypothetical protein